MRAENFVAPFTVDTATARGTGRLVLDAGVDPLPVRTTSPDTTVLGMAWAIALIGFAELTCVEATGPPRTGRRGSRNTRSDRDSSGPRRLDDRAFGRPRFLSPSLTPTADTARLLGHYVVGHRRLLRLGQVASVDAITAAAHSGIDLRAHETWVRPHARGVPDDAELDFIWDQPLAAVVRRLAA